jgi:hypothetical protein
LCAENADAETRSMRSSPRIVRGVGVGRDARAFDPLAADQVLEHR